MSLVVHRPYPGVALLATDKGTVLLGAPADAFKATKSYCQKHNLVFPRVLVAPQEMLAAATPQFNPEFFLYDFLFVYGQAFKPPLEHERLELVLDKHQIEHERNALNMTLVGPSRQNMLSYKDADGRALMKPHHVTQLANVAEHLALKKGEKARTLDDMIRVSTFDSRGKVKLLDDTLGLERNGPSAFVVRCGDHVEKVDLQFNGVVVPYATLPVPLAPQTPLPFAIKALGTRSGFDLSGPTTGFVLWVNGRAVIYDGPVGTRYLLEKQGISGDDIDTVILSHCHEDHMGAFVELILAGRKPKVYTAEPVYRSALVKLASYFDRPEKDVAQYIDYQRIEPGTPVEIWGAQFDFFYTVHSIPTLGVRVQMSDANGVAHQMQISGDTMHHEGLDKMLAAQILPADVHEKMRHIIPEQRVDNATYFSDVGEAIIHGHPKDWAGNPNRVVYYHCPENDHTRSFGHQVAQPGELFSFIEARTIHPATPGRLLNALKTLELDDPAWFSAILFQGQSRRVNAGEVLLQEGGTFDQKFSLIVSGTAAITRGDNEVIATLRPGEFFGFIELVDQGGRCTATAVAETPMELFEIRAPLLHDYVRAQGMQDTIQRIWSQRRMVESARVFRRLDLSVRNALAKLAQHEEHKKGSKIIEQGKADDDFFILLRGSVEVEANGKRLAEIHHTDEDNFFGEIAAFYPNKRRNATVKAKTAVELLRISGDDVRRLFQKEMGVRYALELTIRARSS